MCALPPPHRAPIDTEALGHNMHGDVTLEQIDRAQPPSLELGRTPLWAHAHLPQKSIGHYAEVISLAWQGHERIAAERVVDDALHLGDLRVGPRLEAEREIGISVRGEHETPTATRKEHACPVDVDRLVAPLEVARDLLDDAKLLGVGAGGLQLG